jgi:hypothetical protein
MVRDSSSVADSRVSADPAAAPTPATKSERETDNGHPPRRRRHWLRRILITLVLLVLILAVAIQLVLWSNLPKKLVLQQLQSQLGLRVDASSLTTGWLGNTNLQNVTLGLPMVEQSFLDMPRMRVKHTTLFGLLLRRPVSVELIELENPTLYVRRDQAGRWNLQQVAELVARSLGSKPADESDKQSRPKLPEVRLTDGTVVIQDYGKAEQKIRPLNVHGRPDPKTPSLLYRYDVEVPDHLKLVGQVAPGAPWSHEVEVAVGNLKEWAEPWSPGFPADARLAARWTGQQTDGGVAGRLDLQQATASGSTASGVVLLSTQGSTVTLQPQGLTLTTQNKLLTGTKVASGAIVYDGTTVRTDRLFVAALGGQARVDADYTLATRSGQLKAEWIEVMTGSVRHSGSLDAKVGSTFQNRPQLEATLVSHGVAADGPWDATVQVNGTSAGGWADMDYVVTGKQLDWRGSHPLDLDGLLAKLETRVDDKTHERVIRLAQLQSPGNKVESVGEYNLTTQHWKFWISLNALPMPGEASGTAGIGVPPRKENAATQPTGAPAQQQNQQQAKQNVAQVAVLLNSWGDPEHLEIGQLVVRGAELEVTAGGTYVYARPSPLDLNMKVRHIPPRIAERDRPPLYGYLSGEANVSGTVFQPRNLQI